LKTAPSRSASSLAISLLCMNAKNGSFLWKRHLANHQLTTLSQSEEREERKEKGRGHDNQHYADMFHFGNAVTIAGRRVFSAAPTAA